MVAHCLYVGGQDSRCPNHRYCAYDGTEPGRCPLCHTAHCEHTDGGLPNGTRPCRCASCDELFSSTAAFDKHQTLADGCLPPKSRGLTLVERGDWLVWGFPGEPPSREDAA